jgi:hypothetical protein
MSYLYPSLRDGLVGAWCFSKNKVLGSTTTLYDLVGSNHGTMFNIDPANLVLSDDRYALEAVAADLTKVNLASNPFSLAGGTIAAWHYHIGGANMMLMGHYNSGNRIYLQAQYRAGSPGYNKYTGGLGSAQFLLDTGDQGILDNTWHHVGITWDGASTGKLYLDGVLVDTQTYSGLTTLGANVGISYLNYSSGSAYLNGKLDDVLVYNRPLIEQEFNILANNHRGIAHERLGDAFVADEVWKYHTRTLDGGSPAASDGSYLDDIAFEVWNHA